MKEPWNSLLSVLAIIAFANVADSRLEISFGILETSAGDYFCVSYIPSLTKIPAKANSSIYHISDLANLMHDDTCNLNDTDLIKGKIPFISGDNDLQNCSLAERASKLQDLGALAVISDGTIRNKFNSSHYHINIPVIRSKQDDIDKLSHSNLSETFRIYHLDFGFAFDPAIVVLFIMATFSVMLGSYLSGYMMLANVKQKRIVTGETRDPASDQTQTLQSNRIASQEEDVSAVITPFKVMIYVAFMSCSLVIMYFFSKYIVHLLICVYIFMSVTSTYTLFDTIVMWTYTKFPNVPTCYLPKIKFIEFRQIIMLLFCISIVMVWFFFRKEPWIWTIQDFLGIMISLFIIRDIRLPSLKICTLLLSLLFLYDIFFVFITPLFTSDGNSIMVDVANGGDSGEKFPIVLVVPKMLSLTKHCSFDFIALGLGDIAIPGLLVSYCNCFDIYMENSHKIYWITANVGYVLGLIFTDVSLFISGAAQPALLYLVPCTLVPTFIIALIRGEFKTMWNRGRAKHQRF